MRSQQGIDVSAAGRLEHSAAFHGLNLPIRQRLILHTKQFLRTNRFRQFSAALIALCDAQAKKRFEAKLERRHARYGRAVGLEMTCWLEVGAGFRAAWQRWARCSSSLRADATLDCSSTRCRKKRLISSRMAMAASTVEFAPWR